MVGASEVFSRADGGSSAEVTSLVPVSAARSLSVSSSEREARTWSVVGGEAVYEDGRGAIRPSRHGGGCKAARVLGLPNRRC